MIAALVLAVLVSSALSGALGMGGAIVLMAILAALLPAPAAVALHGAIQLATNGSRAALLWRAIDRPILLRYALGSGASVLCFASASFVVNRTVLFLGLAWSRSAPRSCAASPARRCSSVSRCGRPSPAWLVESW